MTTRPVYTSAVGKPRPDGRWHFCGRCVRDIDQTNIKRGVDVYRWVYWQDQVRHRIYETPVHTFWPNQVGASC